MASESKIIEKEQKLPPVSNGDVLTVMDVKITSHETKPPTPYTEATLLADMEGAAKFIEEDPIFKKILKEKMGLGTAATRDSIIESLKHNKYITTKDKSLIPTEKAYKLIEWLEKVAPSTIDVGLTAGWEAKFQLIEKNEISAESFIDDIDKYITATLASFISNKPTNGDSTMENNQPKKNTPTDKMLNFAKSIASKIGVRVPDDVMVDWDACTKFINDNKDKGMAPSEKQVNFAKSIADRKKIEIPADVLANGIALSKWIDANK